MNPGKGRVVVEGVRMIKKAARKSQDRSQGGFVEREGSIHISNVVLDERLMMVPAMRARIWGSTA